ASDTITGIGRDGQLIVPTHHIRLSRRSARRENKGYKRNRSQVTELPLDEMRDVHAVLAMSQRRGREIGVSHATVLLKEISGNSADPIAEILGGAVSISR